MARKLCSIQLISNISPIENADKIELAQILGWQCVVQKGQFQEGDCIVFCEIDSFLPIKPEYEFLRKSCYKKFQNGEEGFRIKTIRLRGVISQGLVLPLNVLAEKLDTGIYNVEIGQDVTELLGVVQYNPPIPACLMGEAKGQFPSFIPKTDETRVQVLQDVLTRHKGTVCYITEKLDGSSVTYYLKDGEFGVCSRNLELKESEGNAYWKVAREFQIEEKLRKFGKNIALQGELVGFGINGNSLKLSSVTVFFFNVFDIDKYSYLNFGDFLAVIQILGVQNVPILAREQPLFDDIPVLIEMSIGKSMINPEVQREGIVIRPVKEKVDLQMSNDFNNGRVSFKSINPEYLINCD